MPISNASYVHKLLVIKVKTLSNMVSRMLSVRLSMIAIDLRLLLSHWC